MGHSGVYEMLTRKVAIADEVPFMLSAEGLEHVRRRKVLKGEPFPEQGAQSPDEYIAKVSREIARDDSDLIAALEEMGNAAVQPGSSYFIKEIDFHKKWKILTVSIFETLVVTD
jgi:hypothetical protein